MKNKPFRLNHELDDIRQRIYNARNEPDFNIVIAHAIADAYELGYLKAYTEGVEIGRLQEQNRFRTKDRHYTRENPIPNEVRLPTQIEPIPPHHFSPIIEFDAMGESVETEYCYTCKLHWGAAIHKEDSDD